MSRTTAPAGVGRTPAPSTDSQLARSFEGLGSILSDLRGAAAVLEVVEDETILGHSPLAEEVRKKAGLLPKYELMVLTPGEGEALRYATYQLRRTVEKLCEHYYVELDKAVD